MLIKFDNVRIGYVNKVICNNINLEIEDGDYITVFGENGSGKTTFLKTLVGIIPELKGKIIYDKSIDTKSIGYLPQSINVRSDFPASAFEIVLSGCIKRLKFRPFYTKKEKDFAKDVMQIFNISRLAGRPFRELSGGQQQRVLLARAYCSMKKILVLDEPFTGLDPYSVKQLILTLDELNKQGITIIIVSHLVNAALECSKKIVKISKDETFVGTPEEYKRKEEEEYAAVRNDIE